VSAYSDGLDILGGCHVSDVLGALLDFDNHSTYNTGDTTYYAGKYWRAVRQIEPPFLPAFMSGDVPGESDAWRETSAPAILGRGGGHRGGGFRTGGARWGGYGWGYPAYYGPNYYLVDDDYDDTQDVEVDEYGRRWVRRADILGAVDIQQYTKQMESLKQVPVAVAKVLLRNAQKAIDDARVMAKQPWYKFSLPGDKARDDVYWKLQWHAAELAKPEMLPTAMYAPGSDLKHWTVQAFVEKNAAQEGDKTNSWSAAWSDWVEMWVEIGRVIASLPAAIVKKIDEAGEEVAWYLKATGWVIIGAAGLLGYATYKIVTGPTGAALVRRLP
jgi:predicted DNA-binding protein (MmcQ/YjbR family)